MSIYEEMFESYRRNLPAFVTEDVFKKEKPGRFVYYLELSDGKISEAFKTFLPHYFLRNWVHELRYLDSDIKLTVEKKRAEPDMGEMVENTKEGSLIIRCFAINEMGIFAEHWTHPRLILLNRKATLTKKKRKNGGKISAGQLTNQIVKPNFPLNKKKTFVWKPSSHLKK